jgi:hypothetical protein
MREFLIAHILVQKILQKNFRFRAKSRKQRVGFFSALDLWFLRVVTSKILETLELACVRLLLSLTISKFLLAKPFRVL